MNMSFINYQAAESCLNYSDGKHSVERMLDFKLHRSFMLEEKEIPS